MFYSDEYTNQVNFFNELGSSFEAILNTVDKETSASLSQLITEYKAHETVPALLRNLQSSPKAQYHLRSLIHALTHPAATDNDDDDNDDDDDAKDPIVVVRPGDKSKSAASKYRADLIKDVTFDQKDAKVGMNEKHVKVWRLRNSGDEAWPEGCKFVALSGTADSKWITFQLSPVTANPGQVADAGFQFVSPSEPGMYEFRYALTSGDKSGVMTSEPLVLSFTVVEKVEKVSTCNDKKECSKPPKSSPLPPPPPPSSTSMQQQQQQKVFQPHPPPPPPSLQYSSSSSSSSSAGATTIEICDDDDNGGDYEAKVNECVRELIQMGFAYPDRNRIHELMKKHGGNVDAVFNELLSTSQ